MLIDDVLTAIMNRYGSLVNLRCAFKEDSDVVLINLLDDIEYKYSEEEIEEYINLILT